MCCAVLAHDLPCHLTAICDQRVGARPEQCCAGCHVHAMHVLVYADASGRV